MYIRDERYIIKRSKNLHNVTDNQTLFDAIFATVSKDKEIIINNINILVTNEYLEIARATGDKKMAILNSIYKPVFLLRLYAFCTGNIL